MTNCRKRVLFVAALAVATVTVAVATGAVAAPKKATVSGTVIDVTCASKAKAMMDSWANTKNDHMMPGGKTAPGCATMCLKGGQPAALFDGEKISAVFACNPRATLANFAAQEVDVQGFWGPNNTFVPEQIRAKGSADWSAVDCATMHN
jgi:hypothetical protein